MMFKKMLFFATLSTANYDKKSSAFYKKILSNGKRKLIVIANSKINKLLSTKETLIL